MISTKESLQELVKSKLAGYKMIVASNREPYLHVFEGSQVKCIVPASGLTVALDPVMRACGGVWVAHGSGEADREVVDEKNRVMVPPEEPSYTLKRIWLTKKEEDGYYNGFSNQALWPLCHIVYARPKFDETDWNDYQQVNEKFADTIIDEIGKDKALVFVQDYHLALLPRMLKKKNPKIITAQFWHIPWPNPEAFRICPWGNQILQGLLGNDLLGFHIAYHRNNFLDTVERTLETKIDREKYAVSYEKKTTFVKPFPVSIDYERITTEAARGEVWLEMDKIKEKLGIKDEFIGLGLDRLDYTKGIPERLRALDRFFAAYPEYLKKVVFIQSGEPSRIHINKYKEISAEIESLVEEVNWKYQTGDWKPIIFLKGHVGPPVIQALYRIADFCIVSSLHDGMNLVAKEYVTSRVDNDGVLILSRFTGAARELTEALLVNPYATDEFAETIKKAIEMPQLAKQRHIIKLRETVKENNVYKWASDIITELSKCDLIET